MFCKKLKLMNQVNTKNRFLQHQLLNARYKQFFYLPNMKGMIRHTLK